VLPACLQNDDSDFGGRAETYPIPEGVGGHFANIIAAVRQ